MKELTTTERACPPSTPLVLKWCEAISKPTRRLIGVALRMLVLAIVCENSVSDVLVALEYMYPVLPSHTSESAPSFQKKLADLPSSSPAAPSTEHRGACVGRPALVPLAQSDTMLCGDQGNLIWRRVAGTGEVYVCSATAYYVTAPSRAEVGLG